MTPPSKPLIIYIDGGCYGGNPGKGVYWSVGTLNGDGSTHFWCERLRTDEYRTNNQAEALALVWALKELRNKQLDQHVDETIIYSDSKLTVHQFNGTWDVKNNQLKEIQYMAWTAAQHLDTDLTVEWKPRKEIEDVLGH